MAGETKQGFWSRLFRAKGSCCGELKIEEVAEGSEAQSPQAGEAEAGKSAQTPTGKPRPQRWSCCDEDTGSSPGGGCCG